MSQVQREELFVLTISLLSVPFLALTRSHTLFLALVVVQRISAWTHSHPIRHVFQSQERDALLVMRLAISSVATVLAAVTLLASPSTVATLVEDAGRTAAMRRHHSHVAAAAAAAARRGSNAAQGNSSDEVRRSEAASVPDNYWSNPDILYKTQRLFEPKANIRILGPLPPRIAGSKAAAAPAAKGPAGAFRLAASADANVKVSSKPRKATAPKGLINGLGHGQGEFPSSLERRCVTARLTLACLLHRP